MSLTDAALGIVNSALTVLEAEPLTSSDEQSIEAMLVRQHYEETVRLVLSWASWQAALRTAQLVIAAEATPSALRYAFAAPADMVKPVNLVDGHDWYQEGQIIEADRPDVRLRYVRRLPEADWPPYLRDLIQQQLQAVLCAPVTGSANRAERIRDRIRQVELPRAKRLDARGSGIQRVEAPGLTGQRNWL